MNPETAYINYLMLQSDKDVAHSLERVIRALQFGDARNIVRQRLLQQEQEKRDNQQQNLQSIPNQVQSQQTNQKKRKNIQRLEQSHEQRWINNLKNIRFPEYMIVISDRIDSITNTVNYSFTIQTMKNDIINQKSIFGVLFHYRVESVFLDSICNTTLFQKKIISWTHYRIFHHIKSKTNQSEQEIYTYMMANGADKDGIRQGEIANKLTVHFGPIILLAQEIFTNDIFDNMALCDVFILFFKNKPDFRYHLSSPSLLPVAHLLDSIENHIHQLTF